MSLLRQSVSASAGPKLLNLRTEGSRRKAGRTDSQIQRFNPHPTSPVGRSQWRISVPQPLGGSNSPLRHPLTPTHKEHIPYTNPTKIHTGGVSSLPSETQQHTTEHEHDTLLRSEHVISARLKVFWYNICPYPTLFRPSPLIGHPRMRFLS